MLALDAYLRSDYAAALAAADLAACGGSVDGFKGLRDQAVRLREASKQALGDVKLRRTYRVAIDYELPPLPRGVDFKDQAWAYYLEAIRAARMRNVPGCQLLVYKGICAARGTKDHPAVWFLKKLGKAMRGNGKERRFAADFDPQDAETAGYVLDKLGLVKPSPAALQSPAWINAAKALVAYDRGSWNSACRHVNVARNLPGPERDHLETILQRILTRLPPGVGSRTRSNGTQGVAHIVGMGVSGSTPHRRL